MPRYFFDVHDGIEVIDDNGQMLPDIEAAKVEATRIGADFAIEPKMLGELGGAVVVEVRTGPDTVVLTIRLVFSIEVLDAQPGPAPSWRAKASNQNIP